MGVLGHRWFDLLAQSENERKKQNDDKWEDSEKKNVTRR